MLIRSISSRFSLFPSLWILWDFNFIIWLIDSLKCIFSTWYYFFIQLGESLKRSIQPLLLQPFYRNRNPLRPTSHKVFPVLLRTVSPHVSEKDALLTKLNNRFSRRRKKLTILLFNAVPANCKPCESWDFIHMDTEDCSVGTLDEIFPHKAMMSKSMSDKVSNCHWMRGSGSVFSQTAASVDGILLKTKLSPSPSAIITTWSFWLRGLLLLLLLSCCPPLLHICHDGDAFH